MSNPFLRQRSSALAEGIRIVRNVLDKNHFPEGFTTKQMFDLALREPVPAGFDPYPLAAKLLQNPTEKPPKDKYGPQKPTFTTPPYPEHPVRSISYVALPAILSTTLLKIIRFLKKDILGSLKASHEIKMVSEAKSSPIPLPTGDLTKREKKLVRSSTTAWVWKCIPPEDRPKPLPPKPEKFVFGREVGVGLDTSHLNKRRRIARVGKVSRAVDKMKNHQQRMELFQRDEGDRSRV